MAKRKEGVAFVLLMTKIMESAGVKPVKTKILRVRNVITNQAAEDQARFCILLDAVYGRILENPKCAQYQLEGMMCTYPHIFIHLL